jgi:hypothetical protein
VQCQCPEDEIFGPKLPVSLLPLLVSYYHLLSLVLALSLSLSSPSPYFSTLGLGLGP